MNKKIIKQVGIIITTMFLTTISIFAQSSRQQNNSSLLVGDWNYFDEQYAVEIDIDYDGDMEIQVKDFATRTETDWEGYWTANNNVITFNVHKMEIENMNGTRKKRKRLNETWTFNYTMDSNNANLTLSCKNLPEAIATNTVYQREW